MLRYPEPYADAQNRGQIKPHKRINRFEAAGTQFNNYGPRNGSDVAAKLAKKQTNNNVLRVIKDKSNPPRFETATYYAEDYLAGEPANAAFCYPARTTNFVGCG